MTTVRRVFLIVLAFLFFGILIAIAITAMKKIPSGLLPHFSTSWRIAEGLLLFIRYLPAIMISGVLIGYSVSFDHNAPQSVGRWSSVLLSFLKGAYVFCLVLLSVYFIFSEGVRPSLEYSQHNERIQSDDYNEYIRFAKELVLTNNYRQAELHVNSALQIWPKSDEAIGIQEKIRYGLALSSGAIEPSDKSESPSYILNPEGLTILGAIDLAEAAEKRMDFYSMHYYATLADRLSVNTDPNKAYAMRLASLAWNQINEGVSGLKAQVDVVLYRTKREGYDAMQAGDFLSAYYIFQSLAKEELEAEDRLRDPDIPRFLNAAKIGLAESYFFIDETTNMRLFERFRNVLFTLQRSDGTRDVLYIKGVTYTRSSGKDMAFFRDFEYARFAQDASLLFHFIVPYAKMIPFKDEKNRLVPQLLLRSVDRDREDTMLSPRILSGIPEEQDSSVLLLDMNYEDVALVFEANNGPHTMSLINIIQFVEKAELFGFSSGMYLTEAIIRLSDPFLLLIICVLVLVVGWKYRLPANAIFKAWWVVTLPVLPVLLSVLLDTQRYLVRLCVTLFAYQNPDLAMLSTLGVLSFSFFAASMYFFSQRSD